MLIEGMYTVVGKYPGKTLTVLGGVHGNEICGVKALDRAISMVLNRTLIIERGIVHFAYGNPHAIAAGKRQTEMNLNRAFKPLESFTQQELGSYERCRAMELKPVIESSEALLDIHSTANPQSTPFVLCEPRSFHIARELPFPIISHGWDENEPGGTDYYMNKCGGFGICVECGNHHDPLASERALDSMLIFLTLMGAIDRVLPNVTSIPRVVRVYYLHLTKNSFRRARYFADFEKTDYQEIIGFDGDRECIVPAGHLVLFCEETCEAGGEAFLLAVEE